MSNLISLNNVSYSIGPDVLLDQVKLTIETKERICLIGRNGAGKSTLLKIIDGTEQPNSGVVWHAPHLKLARLSQELPQKTNQTVYEFVAEGLEASGELLAKYHHLTMRMANNAEETDLKQLEQLQRQIEVMGAWHFDREINTILSKLKLDPSATLSQLSGGWQRRAALAQALVMNPTLLLLDEPTNHLDIEAIVWLEEYLINNSKSLIFITHDRALLQRLATRIIELDRGNLTSWPGDYNNFLKHKAELLSAEATLNANFDKKLAQEEVWIRQGIKARRTRNEGRVRALEEMRKLRKQRRELEGNVKLTLNSAEQSGQVVIEAENICKLPIIKNFSTRIMRGDRIGLIGPNGIGKTTLLNILLGKIKPDQGHVKSGTKLEIAYFDQRRETLDLEKTVAENVAEGSDIIDLGDSKKHIISYLGDFLFTPARARTPVKVLSGGECNRLLLAKLFSKPTNLLVMDEPTNDLDMETLELLEELLSKFHGTLLLVSHDRDFLDNVVTSTIVFEGEGNINEYIGGYSDWLQHKKNTQTQSPKPISPPKQKNQNESQNELKRLMKKIETLENEIKKLETIMGEPSFYHQEADVVNKQVTKLNQLNKDLEAAYAQWEELENG